ncbi:DUF4157 domain-containing protein [Conexibacter sp. W3-3-2]|uniref:eCIS core domain-containing protein n=1 Tax=Conexibacter sp. W3-3-2 TaxID=2675227 RepID=UPI0018AC3135|nr:DUF4157 domain-containing protein [Conexibacter sp. W3-3-2]
MPESAGHQRRPPRAVTRPSSALAAQVSGAGHPSATLPFQSRLESSFGQSLDGVSARVGAGSTLQAHGAAAATVGDTVVFADRSPSLATVAHETAHVLQNRNAMAPPTATIGAAGGAAEAEAHAASAAAVEGRVATVGASPGGEVQFLPEWMEKLIARRRAKLATGGRHGGFTDADLAGERLANSGYSANPTFKVSYKSTIGTSGTRDGYFKPLTGSDGQRRKLAASATVASRLSEILGLDVLPSEQLATHGGQLGTVSPTVAGVPLVQSRLSPVEAPPAVLKALRDPDEGVDTEGYTLKDGQAYRIDNVASDINLKLPETQRGLWNLQLLDALTAESDRHGGNILVDGSGTVRGIDNDKGFDQLDDELRHSPFDKVVTVPRLADRDVAARILSLSWTELQTAILKTLDADDGGAGVASSLRLTDRELESLRKRFTLLQEHLRGLEASGGLVGSHEWGEETYRRALADGDSLAKAQDRDHANYLRRAVAMQRERMDPEALRKRAEAEERVRILQRNILRKRPRQGGTAERPTVVMPARRRAAGRPTSPAPALPRPPAVPSRVGRRRLSPS